MRKLRFVSVFVSLALLLSASPAMAMVPGPPLQDDLSAELSVEPISNWRRYEDPDYGIALEYPAEWKVKTTIQQPVPFPAPSAIIKRQSFIGPEGSIELDVWLSKGYELDEWLNWYGKTRNKLPITRPNARIAGQPAVVFVEEGGTVDMLTVFFSDGEYVYRVVHHNP